ncbi:GAF domain-containing protein [Paenalcaligenes faecalis]|uniref:GAF domain-containing protein n=1 Tax=Paenalcaligenes faecalis TaxID=2980099 RepID=UPI0022B94811|nr:GAF domain-containing protein [Paenalcaligenes faecalis]
MTKVSLPKTEQERLETLAHLEILDTQNDPAFDNLTQIAANLFDVPISVVSLVGADRAWFKSSVGLNITQLPRKGSFCCRAITVDQLLVIEDTLQDSESTSSPLVTDSPFIRFYAGAPIRAENGLMLGTLCLLDYKAPTPHS